MMMKVINVCPEAMELVNQLCDPGNLEERIIVLNAAEEQLQQLAQQSTDPTEGYNLYDIAYTLKQYKNNLNKLRDLLSDGNDS